MFGKMLFHVRQKSPLIHNITNYVTVNDCANMLLACGASPIMADDVEEAAEITAICQGLNLNIGTLNHNTIPAMIAAGRRAVEMGRPVVLDPVGAGASAFRTETALQLMKELRITVIRGNISEIKTLAKGSGVTRGVAAAKTDMVTEENVKEAAAFVKEFARQSGVIAAVTGEIDLVTDGEKTYVIRNGHSMMSSVTGTGCQLSALTAAFVAANQSTPLEAAAASVCAMGLCGEIGYNRMKALDGNSSYRNYVIDAMYRLTPEELRRGAKYEVCESGHGVVCSDRQGVDRKTESV